MDNRLTTNRKKTPRALELPSFASTQPPSPENLDVSQKVRSNGVANRLNEADSNFHNWYRFVLSFPPHLVREYFGKFGMKSGQCVLDPFCGTGTTILEAKLNGFDSVGIEANAMAFFASSIKTNWPVNVRKLRNQCALVSEVAVGKIARARKLRVLTEEQHNLLLTDSICPVPLHKALLLREAIEEKCSPQIVGYAKLALAKTLVHSASNLHFGPEVGVKGRKEDADVVGAWQNNISTMVSDLASLNMLTPPTTVVHHADSRNFECLLQPNSIDAVFTSPPYPNEKDYTRTTRLESVLLGLISSKEELRSMKKGLLRSNTRGVYKGDSDDTWIAGNPKILAIANEIERRRIDLGKDSGFERLYARVTKLYFGGMARHLAEMRRFLKKGANLGYVVGDQASYLRVMIRTGELLGEIAASLGYQVLGIDLFRTRLATATKEHMREEVLLLRWPGTK